MAGKKMLVVSAHPGDVLWRCSGAIGKHTQLGGTVIDGVCRDVPVIRQLNYPIFTKGRYVVTGKDRVYADRVNEPVLSISGIQVRRGDLVVADDSGVQVRTGGGCGAGVGNCPGGRPGGTGYCPAYPKWPEPSGRPPGDGLSQPADQGQALRRDNSMAETMLVIAAHIGDFVWRCGGAIAKYAAQGHAVHLLVLSDGIRGEANDYWRRPDASLPAGKQQRLEEGMAAAEILGWGM